MKRNLFFLLAFIIVSCSNLKITKTEQVAAYYNGFINSDYNQVKATLADSLTTISGDYITPFTPESYYEQFKWDSVFQPTYEILKLENKNGNLEASVKLQSLKLKFLKNNPMTCINKFYFDLGRINKIVYLDCADADWKVWKQGVDSLVNWTKQNHPELDGFIHDLSMKGAQDYLKAIELFKKR